MSIAKSNFLWSLIVVLASNVFMAFGQDAGDVFYYYHEKKIFVTTDNSELFISFTNKESFEKRSALVEKFKNVISFNSESDLFAPELSIRVRPVNANQNIKDLIVLLQKESDVLNVLPSYKYGKEKVYVPSKVIFELPKESSVSEVEKFLYDNSAKITEAINLGDKKQIVASVNKPGDPFAIANKLQQSGLVNFSKPVIIFTAHSDLTPNDPSYSTQWFLNQTSDADIDAPEAWNITSGLSQVAVAVVDGNGFNLTHPDMTGKYIYPYDAVNQDNDPSPENQFANHGTPCAGLIAAATNNSVGVASVGFNIKVVPIVIGFNATGSGSFDTDDIIIARSAAHIISVGNVVAASNSWGGSIPGGSEESSYISINTQARNGKGALVFASTGNGSTYGTTLYPASYDEVIGVGATDINDARIYFSNYGLPLVDMAAPGSNLPTIDRAGTAGYSSTDYTSFSGTSASCPVAAAVAGLMASADSNQTASVIQSLLCQSCDKVGGYAYIYSNTEGMQSHELGYGRVNAWRAVKAMTGCRDAIITSSSLFLCSGNVTLNSNSHATYSWTGGATTQSINVNSPGTYSVTITDAGCSPSTSSIVVYGATVPTPPVITSLSTDICFGNSVDLNVSSPGSAQYDWFRNGNHIYNNTTSTFSVNSPGEYTTKGGSPDFFDKTFSSNTVVSITPNSCTGISNTINVSGYSNIISSIGISVTVNITHPNVGDLSIFLETPSGQLLGLDNRSGNAGDNFVNTTFSDYGLTAIEAGSAPFTGTYRPAQLLFTACPTSTITRFGQIGGGEVNPNGAWKLRVYDQTTSNSGSLTSWSITFPAFSSCPLSLSNAITVNGESPPGNSVVNSFSSSGAITINDNNIATPYPSTISVSGLDGFVEDISISLNGLTHTFPPDVDFLLKAPNGQILVLVSDCGGSNAVSNANITLSDTAADFLPEFDFISNGVYRPTNYGEIDNFPSPGPGLLHSNFSQPFSNLNDLNPNGVWSLFIDDAFSGDVGTLALWTLNIKSRTQSSPVISGLDEVTTCKSGVQFDIPVVDGATTYDWNLPAGSAISSGSNTNSIEVDFSSASVSGNVTVSTSNSCGAGISSSSFTVNVSQSPVSQTVQTSGPLSFCDGNIVNLSVTPEAGVSYQWNNSAGTILSATNASYNANESGDYNVLAYIPFSGGNCTALSNTLSLSKYYCTFDLNLKTFIQGYYKGGSQMNPAIDPVNHPTWCDTLTIQLAKPVFPYDILYSDKQILNTNGTCTFHFSTLPEYGQYYVVLKHRNSLETWSSSPIVISSNSDNYDFTNALSKAFSNRLVNLGDGNFALYSGDVNQDGSIGMTDFSSVESGAINFISGYQINDITGDRIVESIDYSLVENNIGVTFSRP